MSSINEILTHEREFSPIEIKRSEANKALKEFNVTANSFDRPYMDLCKRFDVCFNRDYGDRPKRSELRISVLFKENVDDPIFLYGKAVQEGYKSLAAYLIHGRGTVQRSELKTHYDRIIAHLENSIGGLGFFIKTLPEHFAGIDACMLTAAAYSTSANLEEQLKRLKS